MKKDSDNNPSHDKVSGEVVQIPLEKIVPNRFQPRKTIEKESLQELIDSISTHGVLQPIVVRRDPKRPDIYEIMMGERRFRSCEALKLPTIPAIITEANDQRMMECALVENTHRKDLNPIERAEAYRQLVKMCRLSQEEVAKRVGTDRATISNFIRLLGLPQEIQEDIKKQKFSVSHAMAILAVPDSTRRLMLWKRARNEDLSVRVLRVLVDAYMHPRGISTGVGRFVQQFKDCNATNDKNIRELEQRLRQKFGAEVRVNLFKLQDKLRSGGIYISFYSDEQYQNVLKMLDVQHQP
ncbi:MAG: ParB/RepB/Spo0J family partition protein [Planctomycetota bacterium]